MKNTGIRNYRGKKSLVYLISPSEERAVQWKDDMVNLGGSVVSAAFMALRTVSSPDPALVTYISENSLIVLDGEVQPANEDSRQILIEDGLLLPGTSVG